MVLADGAEGLGALARKEAAASGCCIRRQFGNDRHALAFERRAPGKVAGQRGGEGFRAFEGGTCKRHRSRVPRPLAPPASVIFAVLRVKKVPRIRLTPPSGAEVQHVASAPCRSLKKGSGFPEKSFVLEARTARFSFLATGVARGCMGCPHVEDLALGALAAATASGRPF
jgi:hypothetical protein